VPSRQVTQGFAQLPLRRQVERVEARRARLDAAVHQCPCDQNSPPLSADMVPTSCAASRVASIRSSASPPARASLPSHADLATASMRRRIRDYASRPLGLPSAHRQFASHRPGAHHAKMRRSSVKSSARVRRFAPAFPAGRWIELAGHGHDQRGFPASIRPGSPRAPRADAQVHVVQNDSIARATFAARSSRKFSASGFSVTAPSLPLTGSRFIHLLD